MYELAAGPVHQADRERQVSADLRRRQLLASLDETHVTGQTRNVAAATTRRPWLRVSPVVER